MSQQIENLDGQSGTTVRVQDGVTYLILYLPDGTIMDISIDPDNGNNHIRLYDDNDYAVFPMDSGSILRDLEVWNSPVTRSSSRGTVPDQSVTVEPEYPDDDD